MKYIFGGQNVDILKQNIGASFTSKRVLYFIISIDDSTVCADSIAKMFANCLCNSSVQYTVKIKHESNAPWFVEKCVCLKKTPEI